MLYDSGLILTTGVWLIFSTQKTISLLANSTHWYADSAAPDNTKNTDVRLLQQLKKIMPGASPTTIFTDFESGMISAFVE